MREATYTALDERRVRIEGSEWVPSPSYTVKLEGAGPAGYQTTILVILRNERYVKNADRWVERLEHFLMGEIPQRTGFGPEEFRTSSFASSG